jgi:DNA-binding response OmpR family regulator
MSPSNPAVGDDALTRSFLLAHDDAAFIALVKAVLDEFALPIEPTPCDDGEAVLARLDHASRQPTDTRPIFLITAQRLPKYDGPELLVYLRASQDWSALPIIVIGDEPTVREVERSLKCGATAYFLKPSTREECRHVLAAILNRFAETPLRPGFTADGGIVERHFVGPGLTFTDPRDL